ncbi:MAG: hypothetical protein ACR2LI_03640, partial [Propionibacteriaceae bacterium]
MMTTTTIQPSQIHLPERPRDTRRRMGSILAASMVTGLTAATVLVVAPFVPAVEHQLTGMVLLGLALGWALLTVLSIRFSDQPQRWAAAPAAYMAAIGLALLTGSPAVRDVLSWVWPPTLFVLVIWMLLRVRR